MANESQSRFVFLYSICFYVLVYRNPRVKVGPAQELKPERAGESARERGLIHQRDTYKNFN